MAWDRGCTLTLITATGCSLVAIVAAVAGAPITAPAVAAAFTALGVKAFEGVLSNLLHEKASKAADALSTDAALRARGLENADLHRLMGQAIALVLDECARTFVGDPAGATYLKNARDAVAKTWATHHPDSRYHAITEPAASRFFSAAPHDIKKTPTLDLTHWHKLVGSIAYDAGFEAHEKALGFAAERLVARYAAALWEAAKHAWKKDDLAWPALQLRLMSEMRGVLETVATQGAPNAAELKALRDALPELAASVRARARGIVRSLGTSIDASQKAVIAEIDDLSSELATAFGQTFESLTALHEQVASVKADTAFIPTLAGDLQAVKAAVAPPLPFKPLPDPGKRGTGYIYTDRRIDLYGRDADMQALRQFLRDDRRVLWWTWTAAAGVGKSRLALEACLEAAGAMHPGVGMWKAGFLDFLKPIPSDWTTLPFEHDTLVVVDYASARAAELHKWLDHLSQRPASPEARRVRVLLLDRQEYDTWTNQLLGDQDRRVRIEGIRYDETRSLPPLEPDALWRIMTDVFKAAKKPLPESRREELLTKLASCNAGNRPLFAAFAADALLAGKDIAAWNEEDLAAYVLGHEEIQWAKAATTAGVGPDALEKHKNLLALATLAAGVDCGGDYDALLEKMKPAGFNPLLPPPGCFAANWGLMDRLASLSNRPHGAELVPLEPDYLGELFVLHRVQHTFTNPTAPAKLLRAAIAADAVGVAAVLLRMYQNFPRHPGRSALMSAVANRATTAATPADPLGASPFPDAVAALFDAVYAAALHTADQPADAAPHYRRALALRPDDADTLNNYANLLSNDPARAAEAEGLYQRALALRPDHAATLNNDAMLLIDRVSRGTAPEIRLNEADERLVRVLAAQPTSIPMRLVLATLRLGAGENDAAVRCLEAVFKHANGIPDGLFGLHTIALLYLHRLHPEHDALLAVIKSGLVEHGARLPRLCLHRNAARAAQAGHPEAAWLDRLCAVLEDRADPAVLHDWPAWRDAGS
ncbi:MAG TPA: hypothetical protein VF777_12480 [Phycisphaerales bacterium]